MVGWLFEPNIGGIEVKVSRRFLFVVSDTGVRAVEMVRVVVDAVTFVWPVEICTKKLKNRKTISILLYITELP
jgi:hypothetical protein